MSEWVSVVCRAHAGAGAQCRSKHWVRDDTGLGYSAVVAVVVSFNV